MPITARKSIINSDLEAYWDAGIQGSYPGTGTTWTDVASQSFDATFVGTPSFSSDNGGVISFDGGGYCSTAGSAGNSTNVITVEAWARTQATASQSIAARYNFTPSPGSGWLLYFTSSGFLTWAGRDGSTTPFRSCQSTTAYNTDTWYHVAGTRNGAAWKIYVNGVNENTISTGTGLFNTTSPTIIGANSYDSSLLRLEGEIGLIRIYNGLALSADQIKQNFETERNRYGV